MMSRCSLFLMKTIQEHDFVLTVVSDTYLRRQACMYEVGEIIRDHHYKDRLLFIVLRENERKYYGESAPEKIGPDIYKGAEDNPTSIMHTELNRQLIKKDRI